MYTFFGSEFLELMFSLLLAAVLGGSIGFERERTKMPAGFRTHVLVTVGAALVMAISRYINHTGEFSQLDPQRLGAQVISGIGFLGAGTIIRYKASVKGLTTAAGLWASACVGLACGIGFYLGAVSATLIILVTLVILKKIEKKFVVRERCFFVEISSEDTQKVLNDILPLCQSYGIDIEGTSINEGSIRFKLSPRSGVGREAFAEALSRTGASFRIL